MTINTEPLDYLIINIINSDNWNYRPTSNNKIEKILPVNDNLRFAIYFLFPEVRNYFYDDLNGRPPHVSFTFNGYKFSLNKQSEAYGQYFYYLTQE